MLSLLKKDFQGVEQIMGGQFNFYLSSSQLKIFNNFIFS